MFLGFVPINDPIRLLVLTTNASQVPTASSTTPSYRVYGVTGEFLASGSLSSAESGSVTGATNASPIVITSASHGLTTGQRVTIADVGGNTAANGTFTITRVDASTFSLDGSTGNGAYTSGGTWTVTGTYSATITPTAISGYAQGEYFDVVVYATISAAVVAQQYRFGVV